MDHAHTEQLNRILSNRRSRGIQQSSSQSVLASPIAVQPGSMSRAPSTPAPSQPRGLAASGTLVSMPQQPPQATGARSSSVGSTAAEATFPRGMFDNFKQKPFIVSTNIRPYTKSDTPAKATKNAAVVSSPRGGTQRGGVAVRTLKNPFRAQSFDEFCQAPIYDPPITVQQLTSPKQGPPNPATVDSMIQPPVVQIDAAPQFDLQQSLQVLSTGDWWLKWTRSQQVHRRYVWLDLSRGVISWANAPNTSFFLQSHVKLEDISEILTQCVVDDSDGRTYYKMVIVTTERVLAIGTELRDKFDVWVDTVQRLCETQKTFTNHLLGRHASMFKVEGPKGGFAPAGSLLPSGE